MGSRLTLLCSTPSRSILRSTAISRTIVPLAKSRRDVFLTISSCWRYTMYFVMTAAVIWLARAPRKKPSRCFRRQPASLRSRVPVAW